MERQKKKPAPRRPKRAPLPSSSSLAHDLGSEPSVRIIFGASVQDMPLVGLTVERARELAGTILNADDASPALVNGRPARGGQVLAAGDTFEIVHHAGEKGAFSPSAGRAQRVPKREAVGVGPRGIKERSARAPAFAKATAARPRRSSKSGGGQGEACIKERGDGRSHRDRR